MSYYHALGGYKNHINIDVLTGDNLLIYQIAEPLKSTSEPISIMRLNHILDDKMIKCKRDSISMIDNYEVDGYDTSYVYVSRPLKEVITDYDIGFRDWAGYSLSLKLSDKIETLEGFIKDNVDEVLNNSIYVVGESVVKKSIPLSYVEAICMPIYTEVLKVAAIKDSYGPSFMPITNINMRGILRLKTNEFKLIKQLLKYYNIEIPIIETFTEEELDLSSIIDELFNLELDEIPDLIDSKQKSFYNKL